MVLQLVVEIKPTPENLRNEWTPASSDDIILKLKETGMWEQEDLEDDGETPIVWTEIKAQKLFNQFKKGERKFFETREGLETDVSIVRADVFYHDTETGEDFYLDSPYWESLVKVYGDDDVVVTTETINHGQKTDKPGVAGKLDGESKSTPELALVEELSEELGLSESDYDIEDFESKGVEIAMSKGFPKLKTTYRITNKKVWVKQSAYQPEYTEVGKPVRKGDKEETEIQHFRWKSLKE